MEKIFYESTRGSCPPITAAEAIISGIAGDGGLYVPSAVPKPGIPLEELLKLDYRGRAYHIMRPFLPDFSPEELQRCVDTAYGENFSVPGIAPLTRRSGVFFLELFHGPTQAFKDMALTILPHLLKTASRKEGLQGEIVILTATSGDTGKAALEGFAGVEGTRVIVFYPEKGVSPMQKRQMVTQAGDNTHVIGIEGNFDGAQRGVKDMLVDPVLLKEMGDHNCRFSSANSINVGRLIPQVVYYFHGYLQACAAGDIAPGDMVNFAVPTGNFGNILAGLYAKKMGLPVKHLLCASNENKVLADFFATGVYDIRRQFVITMSPSMDILVSSNLERLLYEASGRDAALVKGMMADLQQQGWYRVSPDLKENMADILGGYAAESETAAAIKDVFSKSGYLMDPHTAVAYAVYQKHRRQLEGVPTIIVSTASPYKFSRDVSRSLGLPPEEDPFQEMRYLSRHSNTPVPPSLEALDTLPVRHSRQCGEEEMKDCVRKILWG